MIRHVLEDAWPNSSPDAIMVVVSGPPSIADVFRTPVSDFRLSKERSNLKACERVFRSVREKILYLELKMETRVGIVVAIVGANPRMAR